MLDLLVESLAGPGAPFLYAIAAVGAYALAVTLERTVALTVRWRAPSDAVAEALAAGRLDDAARAAGETPTGRVLQAGASEADAETSWEAMGAAAIEAEQALRGAVPTLPAASNIATMLGLLGTVYGLILAFAALGDTAGGERAAGLAEGVSTAMTTTGAGLIVGIATQAVHAWLDTRVRARVAAMEALAGRLALALRRGPPAS